MRCTAGGVCGGGRRASAHLPVKRSHRLYWLDLESIFTGSPRASEEEAARRGKICAGCADNVKVEGSCNGCSAGAVQRMLEKVCGKKSTEHDDKLHSCRHCGCLNKAQIWFPLGLLQRHTSAEVDKALPSHCWKKQ